MHRHASPMTSLFSATPRGPVHRRSATCWLFGLWALVAADPAFAEPAPLPIPAAATATDEDDPQVRERFRQGLDKLREGEPDQAAALLGEVASRARMIERRNAAEALVAYARKLESIATDEHGGGLARDLSDGRTEFIVTSTIGSLYAGVVLVDVLDLDEVRPVVGTLLLTTAAGFTASLYTSRGLGLRAADGEAYSLGVIWGAASGGLLAAAFEFQDSATAQATVLAGGILGGFSSLALSRTVLPTRGQVGVVSTAMPLGFATAMLTTVFMQDTNLQFRSVALMWFGGLQAGTIAGVMLAPDLDWSASRARLTLLGGGLGGLVGWGVAALATGTNGDGSTTSKIWAGSALAGIWGGVALGAWLTEDMAPDPNWRDPGPRGQSIVMPTRIGDAPGMAWTGTF